MLFQKDRFLRFPLKLRRPVKVLTGSVLLSLLVQFFLLPVMLRDYYCITPYAPILNLLVVPLLTLAVGSGAHLTALRRTLSGDFEINNAIDLDFLVSSNNFVG